MQKVLIVVDMQNDFIDGVLGTHEAAAIVQPVLDKIKTYLDAGHEIFFTMDTHDTDYLATQEGKKLPIAHCIKPEHGWRLQADVKRIAESMAKSDKQQIVFEKNIFGSEQLVQVLREQFVGQTGVEIELIGLCTDICVISNAILLRTCLPEANIFIDAECCAGVTPSSHDNALRAMQICQIEIRNFNS